MVDTKELGFVIPEILIPAENIDLTKWACVACDQFTSQPEYWGKVEKLVGNAPSALHIMLPEVYLSDEDVSEHISHMKQVMLDYLEDGILELLPAGPMLTERHMGSKVRKGLLLAMDLEQYDYNIGNKPAIRATEETVLSRIPPRVAIRRGATLEMPHIMLLIDDPEDTVIGNLHMQRGSLKKIYDFDLMMGGGKLEGWLVDEPKLLEQMRAAMAALPRRDNMLYCVGDGNHSLATAKAIWDETKADLSPEEREGHPLRYALCEVINLRDRAVEFMPIHRVLFGVNPSECAHFVTERLNARGHAAKLVFGRWNSNPQAEEGTFVIPFLYRDGAGKIVIEKPEHPLAVGEVQDILEEYIGMGTGEIDYIHGDEAFLELAKDYENIGFYFDALDKAEFFDLIVACGVLPKKTFSLGEAEEKRYYMECRMLVEPVVVEEEEVVEILETIEIAEEKPATDASGPRALSRDILEKE